MNQVEVFLKSITEGEEKILSLLSKRLSETVFDQYLKTCKQLFLTFGTTTASYNADKISKSFNQYIKFLNQSRLTFLSNLEMIREIKNEELKSFLMERYTKKSLKDFLDSDFVYGFNQNDVEDSQKMFDFLVSDGKSPEEAFEECTSTYDFYSQEKYVENISNVGIEKIIESMKFSLEKTKEGNNENEFEIMGIKVVILGIQTKRSEEKSNIIESLRLSYQLLKKKNLLKVWYGKMFFCGIIAKDIWGSYLIRKDDIEINVAHSIPEMTKVIIHELGHRLWFRGMSQSQRMKFNTLVRVKNTEKLGYNADVAEVEPVTEYGKTNIDEAFAEVFAKYVLDEEMSTEQIESFKESLKETIIKKDMNISEAKDQVNDTILDRLVDAVSAGCLDPKLAIEFGFAISSGNISMAEAHKVLDVAAERSWRLREEDDMREKCLSKGLNESEAEEMVKTYSKKNANKKVNKREFTKFNSSWETKERKMKNPNRFIKNAITRWKTRS